MTPRLSVIIRSYNRLPALCELVAALLAQHHDSFEIVVIDQSTDKPADAAATLADLERDARLRVLHFPPLGGAAARNKGIEYMRGELAVFIDDDDVPIGLDFLSAIESAFREDPKLMGLTCQHVWDSHGKLSWAYRALAPRLALRFSRVLGLPDNFARYDRRLDGRHYVHGTGGAYRRSVFERFGGWDDDTPIEDETSLGIRMQRGFRDGEYIAFDPCAQLQRGFDLGGGLDKRRNTTGRYFARFMKFVHTILGRYYPWRVRLMYPAYVFGAWRFTLGWLWDDSLAHDTTPKKLLGTLLFTLALPYHAIKALRVPLGVEPGSGVAMRERVGTGGPVSGAASPASANV
ncbi:MAG TPA: glycosyltransferase family 2 protein [Kofleriaceae bacterium]